MIYKLKKPMMVFYCGLSPVVIGVILVASWAQYTPMTRGSYTYPAWANGVGWLIAMTAILSVPAGAVLAIVRAYRANPEAGLLAVVRKEARHTSRWAIIIIVITITTITMTTRWRENAMKAAREEGRVAEFEYQEEGEGVVRYRRGQAPGPHKYSYDNAAMRSEL